MKLKLLLSFLALFFFVFSGNANAYTLKFTKVKSNYKLKDTDKDGVPDVNDLDDDNDGISDIDESNGYDPTGDIDEDGVANYLDADFGALNSHKISKILDVDNDGIPNHLDLDSDNDGISDNIEAQSISNYIQPSGKISINGIDSNYNKGLVLLDTDYDGIPDFIDLDSDNDGVLDEAEIQNDISNLYNDADGDGIVDYRDLFNINPPIEATMVFDGIDDYVEGPQLLSKFNKSNANGITLMAWVKNDLEDSDTSVRFLLGEENALELKSTGSKLEVYGTFKTAVGGLHVSNFSKINGLKKGIWRHITVSVDFRNNEASIFLDGKWVHTRNLGYPGNHDIAGFYSELTKQSEKFMMGSQNKSSSKHYSGSIDEVRVFDEVLSEQEVQEIVFQEIENDNGLLKGKITPNQVTNKTWDDLVLYYPMSNIICAKIDDSSSNENFAIMHNITSLNKQTAPMPFVTVKDGNWHDKTTWLYGDSWALPGDNISENTSYSDEKYKWGIYHIKNNVKLITPVGDSDKFNGVEQVHALAIIVDENSIANDDVILTVGNDTKGLELEVSNFIDLRGNINLLGGSVLVQSENINFMLSSKAKALLEHESGKSNSLTTVHTLE